ncbi:MAG: hypothetical protein JWQ89_762 [Devosia sp.]|nr:hypothetical protein [Devosia sp.]
MRLPASPPHVEGDFCPVCHRDFSEVDQGSLTAHIAPTIASLTGDAAASP